MVRGQPLEPSVRCNLFEGGAVRSEDPSQSFVVGDMPLYPTFEELKVDELMNAQHVFVTNAQTSNSVIYGAFAEYLGLNLNDFHYNDNGELVPGPAPALARPSLVEQPTAPSDQNQLAVTASHPSTAIVAATPSPGEIKPGLRRVIACKDAQGKLGVKLTAVNAGVLVSFVRSNSPAALAGLRFGDQILEICGTQMAGLSSSKAMDCIRKGPTNHIELVVRDRPFERTIQLNKNANGDLGIRICDGMIIGVFKDSTAARNGLLTNHQIVEVNGQNVMGLKDKELKDVFARTPNPIRLTVLPQAIYKHIVKSIRISDVRKHMDRSLPEA